MRSILDSSFRYTPSSETDVRKTFERIRREQQQAQIQEEQVTQIRRYRAPRLSKEPFDLQLLERAVQRGELKSTEAI
jgi:hypothetical protein